MIGQLDQRITFQRITTTSDGAGGSTVAWANLPSNATVWAKVQTRVGRVGREVMVEGRMTAQSPVTFTVHYRGDVSEMDRIVWAGENYQIRNVIRHGGRKLFLEIDAERGAAQ